MKDKILSLSVEEYMNLAKKYNETLKQVHTSIIKALDNKPIFKLKNVRDLNIIKINKVEPAWFSGNLEVKYMYYANHRVVTYHTTNPNDEGWHTEKGEFYEYSSDNIRAEAFLEENDNKRFDIVLNIENRAIINNKREIIKNNISSNEKLQKEIEFLNKISQ